MKLFNENFINVIKIIFIFVLVYFIVCIGFTDENIKNLLEEDIFKFTNMILFCATISSALAAMLAFLFTSLDRFNSDLNRCDMKVRGVSKLEGKIIKEIKEDLYSIFFIMFFIFIYMLGANSKLLVLFGTSHIVDFFFNVRGEFVIKFFAYIIVFMAIFDIISAILKLLQESYKCKL